MSVTSAGGFLASGIHAGMRRSAKDLAIVRSALPATGAAMFTANRVQAAPVVVSRAHLAQAQPQAVVVNSSSANAATGRRGELDAIVRGFHASPQCDAANRRLMGRRDALKRLALRTGLPEVRSFVGLIIQSDELGTSLVELLRNYAADMRFRRLNKAEKLAAQASTKMLIPLFVFIFPTVFIMMLAPMMKSLISGGLGF